MYRQVPALVIRSVQMRVHAGYAGIDGLAGIESREPLRHGYDGSDTVTNEARLIEERQVVGELKRGSGANFLATVKHAIGAADHGIATVAGRPRETDARREVGFVGGHQCIRVSVLPGNEELARRVVEVALMIAGYAILVDSNSRLAPQSLGSGIIVFWVLLAIAGIDALLSAILFFYHRMWIYVISFGTSIFSLCCIIRLIT